MQKEVLEIDAKQAVEALKSTQKEASGATTSVKELRNQMKAVKDEMAGLEEGSDEFLAAAKKAGELKHQLDEINESVNGASADFGDMLGNVSKTTTGILGGIQAVNGALTLMGVESEEVTKAIQKMQASMAIIQGMNSIDQGIKSLAKLRNAITGTTAAAKLLRAALTPKSILLLTAAVTAIIAIINKFNEKQKEAAELAKQQADTVVEQNKRILDSYGKLVTGLSDATKNSIKVVTSLFNVAEGNLTKILEKETELNEEQLENVKKYLKQRQDVYKELTENADNYTQEELNKLSNLLSSLNSGWLYEVEKSSQSVKEAMRNYEQAYSSLINFKKKTDNNKDSKPTKEFDYIAKYREYIEGTPEELSVVEQLFRRAANEAVNVADNTEKWLEKMIESNKYLKEYISLYRSLQENDIENSTLDGLIAKYQELTEFLDSDGEKLPQHIEVVNDLLLQISQSFINIDYLVKSLDNCGTDIVSNLYAECETLELLADAEYQKNGETQKYLELMLRICEIDKEISYIELERKAVAEEMKVLTSDNPTGYVEEINFNKAIIEIEKEKLLLLKEGTVEYEKQAMLIQQMENDNKRLATEMSIAYTNVASTILNDIGSALNSIADYQQNLIQQELEAGEISEEEAKRKFEENKKLAYAGTVINGLMGIVNAWTSAMSPSNQYLTIFGQIALGLSATIATAAMMAVQLQQIKSQTLSTSGGASTSSSAMSTTIVPPQLFSSTVQGAEVERKISDQKVYVVESDIQKVGERVAVQESENNY